LILELSDKIAGRNGTDHAGDECPDQERDADQIGEHDAGQHGMSQRIAHQRPAFEHQKAGEQGGGHRQDRGDQKGLLHEAKLKR
jgi:hypothetical protein